MLLRRSAIAASVIVLTACSSVSGDSRPSAEPSRADKQFVAAMIPHHDLGLRLLEIGAQHADDVRVRRLVFEMNNYHADDHARLARWAFEWGASTVDDFPGNISDIDNLIELKGTTFDRHWLEAMIAHHRGALVISAVTTRNEDIRSLAERIATIQEEEMVRMAELLTLLPVK